MSCSCMMAVGLGTYRPQSKQRYLSFTGAQDDFAADTVIANIDVKGCHAVTLSRYSIFIRDVAELSYSLL